MMTMHVKVLLLYFLGSFVALENGKSTMMKAKSFPEDAAKERKGEKLFRVWAHLVRMVPLGVI